MTNTMSGKTDTSLGEIFGIACVWFGTHVGGGFATGNQVYQFYVSYGWLGAITPFIAMFIQAWVLRTAIIMARSQNLVSYKDFFSYLWKPYSRLSVTFEIFYWIILLVAVGIAIAGAASLLNEDGGLPYPLAALITGAILFFLTIFGEKLIARASTCMSIAILCACACIFFIGISQRWDNLVDVLTVQQEAPRGMVSPFITAVVYAGFQLVGLPAIIACSQRINSMRSVNTFFWMGFLMNGIALTLSACLLFAWSGDFDFSRLALPNVTICNATGYPWLYWAYAICLFLAFISTGVTCIFGLVVRLENSFGKDRLHLTLRRAIISLAIMIVSVALSLTGLTPLIKYGYGFCGYLAVFVVIIPVIVIGKVKNDKYRTAHPEFMHSS